MGLLFSRRWLLVSITPERPLRGTSLILSVSMEDRSLHEHGSSANDSSLDSIRFHDSSLIGQSRCKQAQTRFLSFCVNPTSQTLPIYHHALPFFRAHLSLFCTTLISSSSDRQRSFTPAYGHLHSFEIFVHSSPGWPSSFFPRYVNLFWRKRPHDASLDSFAVFCSFCSDLWDAQSSPSHTWAS